MVEPNMPFDFQQFYADLFWMYQIPTGDTLWSFSHYTLQGTMDKSDIRENYSDDGSFSLFSSPYKLEGERQWTYIVKTEPQGWG